MNIKFICIMIIIYWTNILFSIYITCVGTSTYIHVYYIYYNILMRTYASFTSLSLSEGKNRAD